MSQGVRLAGDVQGTITQTEPGKVKVDAQHHGILKLDVAAGTDVSTLTVVPWNNEAMEGCNFTPSSGAYVDLKHGGGLTAFVIQDNTLTLSFSDSGKESLKQGGELVIIDFFRG